MSIGVMLFNPFNGKPRHPDDIASDPKGILIWDGEEPLRTSKPAAQWIGLTDEELTLCHSLAVLSKKHDGTDPSFTTLLHRQIEAKLKEKNT